MATIKAPMITNSCENKVQNTNVKVAVQKRTNHTSLQHYYTSIDQVKLNYIEKAMLV